MAPAEPQHGARSRRPLADLRVLDMSRLQPGGFLTGMLADLGADVVRVEQPGSGDPLRPIPGAHDAYNRGKRSITLDLKHERAPEILRRLAPEIDVLVESGRPGALAARGAGYEQLAEINPRLIWCAITGFGQDSPYQDRPAHDISFLGYSGLLALMAGDTVPPTPDFVLAVPYGALVGVAGVLAALHERDGTGRGSFVDASILDAAMWILGEHVVRVAQGMPAGWGETASRRAYRCGDGRLLTLAAAEPRTWAAFCAALDLPDLLDELRASPDRQAEIAARLQAIFETRPLDEWMKLLGDKGAAAGPVNRVEDLLDDPHVEARQSIVELDGAPDTRVLVNPLRLYDASGGAPPVELSRPPELGEHTDTVLRAAGFSAEEIDGLRGDGAI